MTPHKPSIYGTLKSVSKVKIFDTLIMPRTVTVGAYFLEKNLKKMNSLNILILICLEEFIMTNTRITRGKIFFADIPKTVGSTYFGKRPILVLSNNLNNKFSRTITAIPCTTRVGISRGGKKKDLPTHVYIPSGKGGTGLKRDTIVMCENICNYSVEILEECIGEIDESSELMREIEKAVQIQIGIIG